MSNYKEKLKGIVCLIKFVIIVDNKGKNIYSRYYSVEFENKEYQKEFEKNICLSTKNLNIAKDEIDIFALNNYIIVCKLSGEVNIFFGADDNENEVLLSNLYDVFESVLFDLILNSLTKEKLMKSYEEVVIAIDEMINEGVAMNTNHESIGDFIKLKENNSTIGHSEQSSKKGYSLFGGLLCGARDYLAKTINN